jgi:hypothetical protein
MEQLPQGFKTIDASNDTFEQTAQKSPRIIQEEADHFSFNNLELIDRELDEHAQLQAVDSGIVGSGASWYDNESPYNLFNGILDESDNEHGSSFSVDFSEMKMDAETQKSLMAETFTQSRIQD